MQLDANVLSSTLEACKIMWKKWQFHSFLLALLQSEEINLGKQFPW